MAQVSRVFEQSRREAIFQTVPKPESSDEQDAVPWHRINGHEMPPMMLQLRLANGEMLSYSYSDIRQIRVRDAGYVQLFVTGFTQTVITLEGRLLTGLADDIGSGMIRWIQEAEERDIDMPETSPSIVSILIEPFSED